MVEAQREETAERKQKRERERVFVRRANVLLPSRAALSPYFFTLSCCSRRISVGTKPVLDYRGEFSRLNLVTS